MFKSGFRIQKNHLGGHAKKINIRQVFKVLTCFISIFVFVLSSFAPVHALTDVYRIEDYIISRSVDGDIIKYGVRFDVPIYIDMTGSNGIVTEGFDWIEVDQIISNQHAFRIFPLGSFNVPGRPAFDGVLDIRDLKRNSVLQVSGKLSYEFECVSEAGMTHSSDIEFSTVGYFNFYDTEGNFLDSLQSHASNHVFEIPESLNSDPQPHFTVPFDWAVSLNIPENAVYMSPVILSYYTPPTQSESHVITALRVTGHPLYIEFEKNIILEQSDTMQAIEEELREQNDKTDIIIEGTPEINETIDSMSGNVQDQDEQMSLIEKTEEEYINAWNDTNEDLNNRILNFLKGTGWDQLGALMTPVLTWEHWVTIMFMVIAFVNLSVILFGR